MTAASPDGSIVKSTLEVTGRSGDNLTISNAIENTTDVDLDIDDVVEIRPTALAITELQDAFHVLEGSINSQTGTTYTLQIANRGQLLALDNVGPITLTIPPNSSVAFPINTEINLVQVNVGQVTVVAGSGVTLNSFNGLVSLAGQIAGATLTKINTDQWILVGNLA